MSGLDNNTSTVLKNFVERIEKLEEEKSEIAKSIREIFDEARSMGFNPKIMRLLLKTRKMKQYEVYEQEQLLTTYKAAIGMQG